MSYFVNFVISSFFSLEVGPFLIIASTVIHLTRRALPIADHMTSPYWTAPYNMADMFHILTTIDGMESKYLAVNNGAQRFTFHSENVGNGTPGTMSAFGN